MDTITQANKTMRTLSAQEIDLVSGGKKEWIALLLQALQQVLNAKDFFKPKPEQRHLFG